MKPLFAGLDVSYQTTSICVMDSTGSVALETSTATNPDAIAQALKPYRRRLKLVGQESGNLAAWLEKRLIQAKLPMVCLDARHANSALRARINKTDVNDAHGLATLLARGIYITAHVKSDEASRLQSLLVVRDALLRRTRDLERMLDMTHRKIPEKAVVDFPSTNADVDEALLFALRRLKDTITSLERDCRALTQLATRLAKDSPLCARLMSIPGVGPITALNFVAAVDDPDRFKESRNVPATLDSPLSSINPAPTHGRARSPGWAVPRCAARYIMPRTLFWLSRSLTARYDGGGCALPAIGGTNSHVSPAQGSSL